MKNHLPDLVVRHFFIEIDLVKYYYHLMATVDTMIYLKRTIDENERQLLDQGLRKVRGVIAPWFAPHSKSTVLVYFNPELTDPASVLGCIRQLGFDGCIVSL